MYALDCCYRVYIPCLYVLNKIDAITIEELDILYNIPHVVPISAEHGWNMDELLERIWDYLRLIRMFEYIFSSSLIFVPFPLNLYIGLDRTMIFDRINEFCRLFLSKRYFERLWNDMSVRRIYMILVLLDFPTFFLSILTLNSTPFLFFFPLSVFFFRLIRVFFSLLSS